MFPLSIPIANTADPSCKILGANPTAVTAALSLPVFAAIGSILRGKIEGQKVIKMERN